MDDWDQEKLEHVVASKGKEYNQSNPTEIVCKYFLDAVEKKQYGWFWVCPNASKECHYRHALPPGYVLKSQMKALLEDRIPIEEEIENQVCKYFLDAVEKKQYGWFWVCPNASKECHYRHALPPGYVLKSQMKALLEDRIPIEEEIENQTQPNSVAAAGPSSSKNAADEPVDEDPDDDDDERDLDELNEIEASLSKTSIQIKEPEA